MHYIMIDISQIFDDSDSPAFAVSSPLRRARVLSHFPFPLLIDGVFASHLFGSMEWSGVHTIYPFLLSYLPRRVVFFSRLQDGDNFGCQ